MLAGPVALMLLAGAASQELRSTAQAPPAATLAFEDVAAKAGILEFRHVGGSTPDKRYIPEVMSGGVCAADFDRDGWADLLFINGGSFESAAGKTSPPPHALLRNTGGRFTNVTGKSGISNAGWGMGCAVADYDNDGDADVYVTNFLASNQLWRNDGDWRFSDVSVKSGAAGPRGRWNAGATFGDYDGDGRLDLFVAGYVHMDPAALPDPAKTPDCRHRELVVNCGPRGLPGEADLLFHNEGNGTFREVTAAALDPKKFYGLGAAFLPLGSDGAITLLVANDSTPNALYTFAGTTIDEVALGAGVALSEQGHEQAGMGIGWGDYDDDGLIDLYVTNFVDDYNTLYRAIRPQQFADVTRRAGLAQPTWLYMGWGTAFADFDRDGRDDIIVVNGHVYPQVDQLNLPSKWRMPPQGFHNRGSGRFEEVPRAALPGAAVGRGVAIADFWNDGTLGVAVNNLDGSPALYKPVAPAGRYVELLLEGTRITDATGARVDMRWEGGRATRLVVSGGSYLSSHDARVHAGVADAKTVDVEIIWPGGERQALRGLETNRLHRVRQGGATKVP